MSLTLHSVRDLHAKYRYSSLHATVDSARLSLGQFASEAFIFSVNESKQEQHISITLCDVSNGFRHHDSLPAYWPPEAALLLVSTKSSAASGDENAFPVAKSGLVLLSNWRVKGVKPGVCLHGQKKSTRQNKAFPCRPPKSFIDQIEQKSSPVFANLWLPVLLVLFSIAWQCTHSIFLACEYRRLSFTLSTTRETRRKTSTIRGQKFHTDDVNLPALTKLAPRVLSLTRERETNAFIPPLWFCRSKNIAWAFTNFKSSFNIQRGEVLGRIFSPQCKRMEWPSNCQQ